MSQEIFNIDENALTIFFSKIYSADVTTVWDYYTKPELLEQWWMPKPWKAEVISQDFRDGGNMRYVGVGPNNEKHFAGTDYHEIRQNRSISMTDYFTDENGNPDSQMPVAEWLIGFTGVEEGTKITVNMHYKTLEDLRKTIEMSFKEGVLQAAEQLEEILTDGLSNS